MCVSVGDSVSAGYNNYQQMSDLLDNEMKRYVEY